MRFRMVAPVVALALVVLAPPAVAQVPAGPLSIHVEAVLGEPTTVGNHTVLPFSGTAILRSSPPLVDGESDVDGVTHIVFAEGENFPNPGSIWFDRLDVSGGPLINAVQVLCTELIDRAGNGSGRCASSGEVEGTGTWAGRLDGETRSPVLDIHLQVVCPRCVPR